MSSPSRLFVFEVEDVLVDATELVGEAVDQFIQERFGEALDPFTLGLFLIIVQNFFFQLIFFRNCQKIWPKTAS